jgi:bifunctional non-homologous end joining protein LigD
VLPKVDPLRPVKRTVVPTGKEWIYELKLDGFRGMLVVEDGRGSFTSKTSKRMPRFQELADALARDLGVRDAILDGEIIVMGDTGPDFNALFFRRGQPAYAALDLLWLNGKDLRERPLWRRKQALRRLLNGKMAGYVDHVESPALFDLAKQQDLEGIVAKRRSDPYAPGTEWVKVKVAGYTQMVDRWELFQRRKEKG